MFLFSGCCAGGVYLTGFVGGFAIINRRGAGMGNEAAAAHRVDCIVECAFFTYGGTGS